MKKITIIALALSAIFSARAQFYNEQKTIYVTTEGKVYSILKGDYGDTIDATHEQTFTSQQAKQDMILRVILLALYKDWEEATLDHFKTESKVLRLRRQVDSLGLRIMKLEKDAIGMPQKHDWELIFSPSLTLKNANWIVDSPQYSHGRVILSTGILKRAGQPEKESAHNSPGNVVQASIPRLKAFAENNHWEIILSLQNALLIDKSGVNMQAGPYGDRGGVQISVITSGRKITDSVRLELNARRIPFRTEDETQRGKGPGGYIYPTIFHTIYHQYFIPAILRNL